MARFAAPVIAMIIVLLVVTGARSDGIASTETMNCGERPLPCAGRSFAPNTPGLAPSEDLALKYAPIVYMKEQSAPCDDKGEAFYPAPVEIVLGNPDVALVDPGGNVVTVAPTASDLHAKGKDYYLDLPGNPREPGCVYEQAFRELAADHPPVVYARVVTPPGESTLALQYWLYFYFNDWNNNHESDWEFIQLLFPAESVEAAMTTEPSSLVYAQHGGGERAEWHADKVRKEDGHPVIYVPKGSHGSLYGPHTSLGKGESGTGFGCDDATPPSERFAPEVRLIPDEISGADDPFAWIAYEGRWGEKASGEFNGPTGPNTKQAWTDPIAWQNEQRDTSVTVPETTVGPNAAKTFCAVVAAGSKLLFEYGTVAVLALIGAVVGSIGLTARRTRFRPVVSYPLRQRRSFGQILASAFRVLRSNRQLLGIGALFVPLGLMASGIQQIVLRLQPLESLLDLTAEAAVSGGVALALGGLGFSIGYWLVLCAVTAALDDLDSPERSDIRRAIRMVRASIWQLNRARLRALTAIVLLSATIIGIPLAIQLAVRWTFLEQAILLERLPARESREASERLVSGHWWRTLGFLIAVGWGTIALGPIVGMIVLLFSSATLEVVNLISSIIYVILVPYAAICFTMLYFDLKEEHASQRTLVEQPYHLAEQGLEQKPAASP